MSKRKRIRLDTPESIERRKDELLERELRASNGQKQWVWLSFCDTRLPPGSQFLGGCLVQGCGFFDAVMESHRLGLNPGGEVQGTELGPDHVGTYPTYRLLSRAEIDALEAAKAEQVEVLES